MIDSCIESGILKVFLLKNRAEMLGIFLEEFDVEKYANVIRDEGKEEGIHGGREAGNRLGALLVASGCRMIFISL